MKRLLSVLLCLLMLLPLVSMLPFDALAADTTTKFTVTDKNGNATTTFVYGEPIMVTPLVGEGTDWIGIAPKGKVSSGSVRYKRIAAGSKDSRPGGNGKGLNVPVDIRMGAAVESRFAASADIGVGEWTIFWCVGSGSARDYDKTSAIDITVTAGPMTVNKTAFAYGEPILVTATAKENPTYKSWYGIVPDSNGEPKLNFGTIIWRNADGTEDDLRNTANDTGTTGTMGDAKQGECATWLGISKGTLRCLPAGTYWLIYCEDSSTIYVGGGVTHKIQIKITKPFTTDKTAYAYGEPINVSVTAGGGVEAGDHIFIAPRDADNIEATYNSVRWQTLTADQVTNGFNIRESKTTSNYPEKWDIPPGDYSLFVTYAPNSTAPKKDLGTRIDITVSGYGPDAPTGITYDLNDKTTGSAGGTVVVSLDPNEVSDVYNKPTHVILYWGDENGKLADYTYISLYKVTGATVEIEFTDITMIPEEATRLMACCYNGAGVSQELVSVDLPADRTVSPANKGALISSFQIVSDIHSQESQTHKYNQRIAQMLADIKAIDPNTVGVFVAGDNVNDGWVEEYENLYALWEQSGLSAPIFMASGNHEWKIGDANNSYTSNYNVEKDRFITYVNKFLTAGGYEDEIITNGKPYYDLWINGVHYVCLASEAAITHAYLSDAQLSWLREKLTESRDANAPTFILLHQQMYNVVDGAMPIQDWDGVIAGDANYAAYTATGVWKTSGLYEAPLREILAEFPSAMVFSGHSHWDMTDRNNVYDPDNPTDTSDNPTDKNGDLLYADPLPNYLFNTGSVAYLVSGVRDEAGASYSNWASSKGYYVRVYENCIEICGRDFSTAQWVPNAMYRISLADVDLTPHTHTYDNDCDAVCNECGETRTVGDHQYTGDCDTDCNECGAIRTAGSHAYDNACDKDCNECGAIRITAAHQYDNGCDADCNVCNATRTPDDHKYSNDCDVDCNVCGETRTVGDHQYENDCDPDCDLCGATRTVGDHQYENDCDTDCNECGAIRTVEGHKYDNACDTDCNVCGELRTFGGHKYDNACDADCNECGETREPEAHKKQHDCSTNCSVCGQALTDVIPHKGAHYCSEICQYCGEKVVERADGVSHALAALCANFCSNCGESVVPQAQHDNLYDCSDFCRYCRVDLDLATTAHSRKADCSTHCSLCDDAIEMLGEHERLYPCSEICKHCELSVIPDPADHTRTYECSTDCKDCGATLAPNKAHESLYPCSSICRYCSQPAIPTPTEQHDRGAECSTVCTVCGETMAFNKHHERLHPCSEICKYCEQPVLPDPADHDRGFDCSTTCVTCGETMPAFRSHEGAFPCSEICQYCSQKVITAPTASHAGQYECSVTCATCSESITPRIQHSQLSDCSNLCSYCRTVQFMASANHEGTYACSTTCKHCNATITATEPHESAYACSNICKNCHAATVTPTAAHTTTHPCSTSCTVCGATFTAAPHTYGAWQTHNDHQHKKTCACGDVAYENHAWNDGEVTTAPTATQEGSKTFTCATCNATKTETIEKLSDEQSGNGAEANGSGNGSNADQNGGGSGVVVVIVICSAVAVAGGGFAVYYFILRKKKIPRS